MMKLYLEDIIIPPENEFVKLPKIGKRKLYTKETGKWITNHDMYIIVNNCIIPVLYDDDGREYIELGDLLCAKLT